jgi:hypothetical protein
MGRQPDLCACVKRKRRKRDQTPGQPAGDADVASGAACAGGAELFQEPAVRAGDGRMPGFARNSGGKNPRRLSAEQGERYFRSGEVRDAPLDQPVIRRLVVLKLRQARDTFDPAHLLRKFEDGREFDWDDLRDLVRRAIAIDRERITANCVRGFRFVSDLTAEEQALAADGRQRERALWERLTAGLARA